MLPVLLRQAAVGTSCWLSVLCCLVPRQTWAPPGSLWVWGPWGVGSVLQAQASFLHAAPLLHPLPRPPPGQTASHLSWHLLSHPQSAGARQPHLHTSTSQHRQEKAREWVGWWVACLVVVLVLLVLCLINNDGQHWLTVDSLHTNLLPMHQPSPAAVPPTTHLVQPSSRSASLHPGGGRCWPP